MKVLIMGIGKRIAQLRLNHQPRLTQEEFAKKIGISRAALSHYEKDRRDPDYETLQKIADFFDVSTDLLLGRDEKKSSYPGDEAEFEKWLNDPTIDKFYREFKESPEERKEALLAVWEIIKKTK